MTCIKERDAGAEAAAEHLYLFLYSLTSFEPKLESQLMKSLWRLQNLINKCKDGWGGGPQEVWSTRQEGERRRAVVVQECMVG